MTHPARGDRTPTDAPRAPAGPLPAVTCCWIGGARYSRPLDAGQARKWHALARLGVRMHVVGLSADAWPRSFTEHAVFHLLPNCPVALVRHLTMLLAAPWVLLWIAVRHRARIFIAQSPFEGAAAAAVKVVLALFGRRVALIVESHGDFERSVFLQRRVWFAATYRRLMRLAARGALRHADLGRAVSQATRNQLRSWRGDLPIVVFPAWVDVELFTTGERPTPPSACQGILFAGAIVPRKGVHVLIDAFSQIAGRVPAAHLVIAGAEDNARYAAELRNQARALGLESRLEFVGHVPANRLVELIDRARLLALPSFSEGLPRVLLEAMLRGTPTVATRVSGTPELVRPMETGYLVDPGDASALAEALLAAFLDADIDRMGRRARDAARARVSVDDYVKGHRRLIGAACTRLGVM